LIHILKEKWIEYEYQEIVAEPQLGAIAEPRNLISVVINYMLK
jgi:hypothetical protein